MTRRLLFTASVLALAIVSTPQSGATAQNNDDRNNSQANSSQSNSGQHQAASSNSSNANSNSNSSAQSNERSQNENRTSSQDRNATSNNSGRERDRDNKDRDADRDNSNRDSDLNTNRGHESRQNNQSDLDRSLLNNQNRDKNNERQSYDRSRDASSQADNRSDSRRDRSRSYRQDFKFGRAVNHGLTLSSVTHNSVFYKSGLRDNDVIVSYNGHRIRNEDDFDRYVVYEQGRVPVVVYRNGREQTIYVVNDDRENVAQADGNRGAYFGAEFDSQSNDAAFIVRVEEGSPADRAGLKRDDVVTAINGDRVSSGHDAEKILGSMNAGQRVEVDYSRQGRAQVTLGGSARDSKVETTSYQSDDHPAVAIGANPDGTRRDVDRRNYNQERREDRRDNRGGLLPRLRN